jgi:hypothetical protein
MTIKTEGKVEGKGRSLTIEAISGEVVTNNIVVKGVIRGHEQTNNTLDVKGKLKADNSRFEQSITKHERIAIQIDL